MTKWYLPNSPNPVSFREVVSSLQEKRLSPQSLVWTPGLHKWHKIENLRDFSSDRIGDLYQSESDLFAKRKFPRATVNLAAWVHNRISVWPAKISGLGQRGATILISSPQLKADDNISVHVRKNNLTFGFNQPAKILSLSKSPSGHKWNTIREYHVQFESVTAPIDKCLLTLITEKGL